MEWEALKAALPWLALLPNQVVERLAFDEFVVPGAEALAVVEEAQAALPTAYLMPYRKRTNRRSAAAARVELCQVLRPADLTAVQLAVVRAAERRLGQHGVVLCAYARPLARRR